MTDIFSVKMVVIEFLLCQISCFNWYFVNVIISSQKIRSLRNCPHLLANLTPQTSSHLPLTHTVSFHFQRNQQDKAEKSPLFFDKASPPALKRLIFSQCARGALIDWDIMENQRLQQYQMLGCGLKRSKTTQYLAWLQYSDVLCVCLWRETQSSWLREGSLCLIGGKRSIRGCKTPQNVNQYEDG